MNSGLFIALFAGLSGMLGWGSADFFAKKTIDEIGDVVSLVWAHILGTAVIALIALYSILFLNYQLTIPKGFFEWIGLVFFGALQGIIYLLVYQGFGKEQVAILNPIFASFPGLTAILSILVFREAVGRHLIAALMTIFLGIILLNLDFSALHTKKLRIAKVKGFYEILFATLLAAFWTLFWGKFVQQRDWLSYALFMYAFMTITVLAVAVIRKIKLS